jgi:hypothetical protein
MKFYVGVVDYNFNPSTLLPLSACFIYRVIFNTEEAIFFLPRMGRQLAFVEVISKLHSSDHVELFVLLLSARQGFEEETSGTGHSIRTYSDKQLSEDEDISPP